jgi:hypothetical protein
MHIRICLIIGFLSVARSLSAAEKLPVLEAGDDVYTNVTVTKVTATDVFFSYNGGLGNVKLKNLDPQWQKHFHYAPEKAGMVETQQVAATSGVSQKPCGQTGCTTANSHRYGNAFKPDQLGGNG